MRDSVANYKVKEGRVLVAQIKIKLQGQCRRNEEVFFFGEKEQGGLLWQITR